MYIFRVFLLSYQVRGKAIKHADQAACARVATRVPRPRVQPRDGPVGGQLAMRRAEGQSGTHTKQHAERMREWCAADRLYCGEIRNSHAHGHAGWRSHVNLLEGTRPSQKGEVTAVCRGLFIM